RSATNENGAGAALAESTTEFRTVQPNRIPQDIEQRLIRIPRIHCRCLPVNAKLVFRHGGSPSGGPSTGSIYSSGSAVPVGKHHPGDPKQRGTLTQDRQPGRSPKLHRVRGPAWICNPRSQKWPGPTVLSCIQRLSAIGHLSPGRYTST